VGTGTDDSPPTGGGAVSCPAGPTCYTRAVTRRLPVPLAAVLCVLALAGCGASAGVARATAPALPATTGTPAASASPSPSATPVPTPTPTPSPTPSPGSAEGGVERVPAEDSQGDDTVAADLYPSSGFANCPSMGPTGYGACPVTPRLADRLNQHPIKGVEPLCRCQQQWQGVSISAPPALPAVTSYTVEVDLSFGGTTIRFDVTVLRDPDGWFADDIRCHGGDASTSIYATDPPLCGS
jgi:hypothetical protein